MIKRVLLVCSGNTCRSPMAAALLRHLWEQAQPGWNLEVLSAGTGALAGDLATEYAVEVMRRRGHDLGAHRARRIDDGVLDGVDLVLAMTERHKDALLRLKPDLAGSVFTLGEYAGNGQDVSDPFGGTLDDYEATATVLESILAAIVARIRKEGTAGQ